MNFEIWRQTLADMTQQQKDDALIRHIDLLCIPHVEELIRAGAHTTNPPQKVDVMSWAVSHTQDFDMIEKLVDLGLRCEQVEFSDFEYCFYEDPVRMTAIVARMTLAGMPLETRAETFAYAVKRRHKMNIHDCLVPGEDPMTLICTARYYDESGRVSSMWVTEPEMDGMWKRHVTDGISSEKLAQNVNEDGMTGWMLSVRAGQWDAVASSFARHPEKTPDPAQFTRTDVHGQSVISMLGARDRLGALFTPVFFRDAGAAARLIDALPEYFRSQVDRDSALAAITRSALYNESKARPHLRLKK
jgi:hypothetical protein